MVKRIELDLSVPRSDYEIEIKAKRIYVERCDGNVIMKFEDKQSDFVTLIERMVLSCEREIKKIYISNKQETGKLVLVVYSDLEIKL